ncbi:cysteine desulfurase [Gordoniibacillus kamchatkensis]|uniref:cysteine desulfurase n=1 Tax=Gordoniibacillus kamchatkensis TaxID=1590651 RepID=A0ABR5AF62_9BACL|nr:aminotransferase class V-fold PLP-dependent enzyme [Paenibacillus sp. VKM B-2647]KIL39621.1 cysteine desulfurase [Paenibacillus sp. VKM B-2647]
MSDRMIYLDHAASSWPKPPEVVSAVVDAIEHHGANPGRGSHRMAIEASRIVFEARVELAALLGIGNPMNISFSMNTSEALNLAIKGFLKQNDHVICTSVEHNSVRRPLEYVKRTKNVSITYVETDVAGRLNLAAVQNAFQPNTKLLVCTHSSNLLGSINPLDALAELCKQRGVKLLVDAAQTAGTYPLDAEKLGIDMLAFPGHKGLLGPQGTGGLYVHPEIELEPLIHGGTGSQSETVEQPTVRPDRYEAGTQNVPGIVGLRAGARYVKQVGSAAIHRHEWELTQRLMEGLLGIEGATVLGPEIGHNRTGIVSFLLQGRESAEVAHILDRQFHIAVRAGHHCAPLAHQSAGTLNSGAVRASVGYSSTPEEIDALLEAVRFIRKAP